jgi:tRNA(Arg) A34 adenosine deaminase TadA
MRTGASLVISVPAWVAEVVYSFRGAVDDDEGRMGLALELARENVARGGGPFGAVVFSGARLIGAGVNLVLASGFSIAHAEVVALMTAQQSLHDEADLGGGASPYSLVTSTEPCAQCFGAVVWAGVTRLVCGATTADAEAIGFDEGPKPEKWDSVLGDRSIAVALQVRRDEARAVLNDYRRRGGSIYGMRRVASAGPASQ